MAGLSDQAIYRAVVNTINSYSRLMLRQAENALSTTPRPVDSVAVINATEKMEAHVIRWIQNEEKYEDRMGRDMYERIVAFLESHLQCMQEFKYLIETRAWNKKGRRGLGRNKYYNRFERKVKDLSNATSRLEKLAKKSIGSQYGLISAAELLTNSFYLWVMLGFVVGDVGGVALVALIYYSLEKWRREKKRDVDDRVSNKLQQLFDQAKIRYAQSLERNNLAEAA